MLSDSEIRYAHTPQMKSKITYHVRIHDGVGVAHVCPLVCMTIKTKLEKANLSELKECWRAERLL